MSQVLFCRNSHIKMRFFLFFFFNINFMCTPQGPCLNEYVKWLEFVRHLFSFLNLKLVQEQVSHFQTILEVVPSNLFEI